MRESYFATKSEVKRLFCAKQSLYILFCKNQILTDENLEIGQIQAKGLSGEGRRPKWRRMKAQVEKDEGQEAETLSRLLIVAEGPD